MMKLGPDEQLLSSERRHWLPIALQSVSLALAAIFPLFFLVSAEFLPVESRVMVAEYRSFIWFLYATWLLGLWMAFAMYITNYYLDVLIITNRRVIDVEQIGLFSRDVAELHLDSIRDIHVEIKGFIPSLFNYGVLHIQTSAATPQFSMTNVRDPHRIQEAISKARLETTNLGTNTVTKS